MIIKDFFYWGRGSWAGGRLKHTNSRQISDKIIPESVLIPGDMNSNRCFFAIFHERNFALHALTTCLLSWILYSVVIPELAIIPGSVDHI